MSSLGYDCVKVAESEEERFEVSFSGALLKSFLIEVIQSHVKISFDSARRFASEFDARLEQSLNI